MEGVLHMKCRGPGPALHGHVPREQVKGYPAEVLTKRQEGSWVAELEWI